MDDYIRRHLAYKAMCEMRCGKDKGLCVSAPENCLAGRLIAEIPSEKVEPVKQGQWLYNPGNPTPYCSCCGNSPNHDEETDYCPKCGANMGVLRNG